MQQLRKAYDGHLAHWQTEAVPHNNYERFGTLFDRNIAWLEKEGLIRKKTVEKSGTEEVRTNRRQLKRANNSAETHSYTDRRSNGAFGGIRSGSETASVNGQHT